MNHQQIGKLPAKRRLEAYRANVERFLIMADAQLAEAEDSAGDWHDEACEVTGNEVAESDSDFAKHELATLREAVEDLLKHLDFQRN